MTRKLVVCLFVMAAIAVIVAGQDGRYTVQPGDNLWWLSGVKLGDPTQWRQVVESNPFLNEAGRQFERDGKFIVLIRPGEQLEGLEELGILPSPLPITELNPTTTTTLPVAASGDRSSSLWWLLLLVPVLLGFLYSAWRRSLRNPATSGPAMVRGGVTDDDASSTIRNQAIRMHHAVTGVTVLGQSFRIISLTHGHLFGAMRVRYADGRERTKLMTGDTGYRALVEFPGGRREELYMLQACGNDLRFSGVSRYVPGMGFRFVPAEEVLAEPPTPRSVPQPTTEPVVTPPAEVVPVASEPVVVAPESVPAAQSTVSSEEDGVVRIEFKRATDGHSNDMLRISGIDVDEFVFTHEKSAMTLRFKEREQGEPEPAA